MRKFFTPNNDTYNDFWALDILSNDCDYTLYIFDRYGKLLKTLTPNNSRWDGKYKGENMPANDYWYLLKYTNSESEQFEYRSNFSLIR